MEKALLRRFRREIRQNKDIEPRTTICLSDDPRRAASTQAATLLLKTVFQENIAIEHGPDGIICGSREEAAVMRLQAYTQRIAVGSLPLLNSLTKEELETLLKQRDCEHTEVWIPPSAELDMIKQLGTQYPDVLYGL